MNRNATNCTKVDAAAASLRGDISCGYNGLANAADRLEKNCDEMAGMLAEIKENLRKMKESMREMKESMREMREDIREMRVMCGEISSGISQLKWMIGGMYILLFILAAEMALSYFAGKGIG